MIFAKRAHGSHRARLTIIVSVVFGAILAILFWIASRAYESYGAASADVQLGTVINAVAHAVGEGATENSLEEVSHSPLGVSVTVFDEKGEAIRAVGPLELSTADGSGVTKMSGVLVRYMSTQVGSKTIVVARNWLDHTQDFWRLNLLLVAIWLPLTATVGGITWLSTAKTFKPLLAMADEAKALSNTGPNARLAIPHDVEFGQLATRLNEFLDRIQASVNTQERFVADAAHELRTPLTILRGQIERVLLRERDNSEYQRVLQLVLDESVRMSSLVESLLVSSRAATSVAVDLDLLPHVQDAYDHWEPRFKERDIRLVAELDKASAQILAPELELVIDNLLGNALAHSPAGSVCTIKLETGPRLVVEDQGPGIPDEFKVNIFERFYRTDAGRNRDKGGFGIGLAICKRIANERGAKIWVEDNAPNGSRFIVAWNS